MLMAERRNWTIISVLRLLLSKKHLASAQKQLVWTIGRDMSPICPRNYQNVDNRGGKTGFIVQSVQISRPETSDLDNKKRISSFMSKELSKSTGCAGKGYSRGGEAKWNRE